MTDWKLKLTSYLYALPWQGLGQAMDEQGIPYALIRSLNIAQDELDKAAAAVAAARGLVPKIDCWQEFFLKPVVKHPLSGRTRSLEITKDQAALLGSAIIEEVLNLQKDYAAVGSKQLYLAVWRLLREKVGARCGSNALLFPAFSQMPDRSMWDQAQLAAAFSTTYADGKQACRPALFSFSLGSVQEYVFTARRTQDFWAGSFTQSFVIWRIIKRLAETYGPDAIVYPDLHNQPLVDLWLQEEQIVLADPGDTAKLIAGFPNVFTVLIPQESGGVVGQEVQTVLCQVRNEMFQAVDELLQNAFQRDEHLSGKLRRVTRDIKNGTVKAVLQETAEYLQSGTKLSKVWSDIWERQKEHFLSEECFYVVLPWVNDEAEEPLQWLYRQYEKYLPQGHQQSSNYQEHLIISEEVCHGASEAEQVGLLYQPAGALAGRMLAAGKNLRYFTQSIEPGYKCSLCGTRQALTVAAEQNGADEIILRKLWQLISGLESNEIRMTAHLKSGEHLCAVCLVKRLAYTAYFRSKLNIGDAGGLFPSVASIANAACKHKIIAAMTGSPEIYGAVCGYVQTVGSVLKKYRMFSSGSPVPLVANAARTVPDPQNIITDFIRLDGCWLYEESFIPESFSKEIPVFLKNTIAAETIAEDCQLAGMALQELIKAIKKYNKNQPVKMQIPMTSKYYAVVYMDGDKMGEWVQGKRNPTYGETLLTRQVLPEKLQQTKRPMEPIVHINISKALKNFSQILVPHIVETDYPAKLVYAGGDDVMALVPVDSCLAMVNAVRQAFSGEGEDNDKGWKPQQAAVLMVMDAQTDQRVPGKSELRRAASASCGIVIAHYSQPLQQVLDKAAKVLKKQAKDKMGRDAFAVLVDKRGGEPLVAGGKWKVSDMDIPATITRLTTYWQQGLSPELAYRMAEEQAGLAAVALAGDAEKVAREPRLLCQQGRLSWLVDRHSTTMTKENREEVKAILQKLLATGEASWEQLVNILLLTRFISRGGNE